MQKIISLCVLLSGVACAEDLNSNVVSRHKQFLRDYGFHFVRNARPTNKCDQTHTIGTKFDATIIIPKDNQDGEDQSEIIDCFPKRSEHIIIVCEDPISEEMYWQGVDK